MWRQLLQKRSIVGLARSARVRAGPSAGANGHWLSAGVAACALLVGSGEAGEERTTHATAAASVDDGTTPGVPLSVGCEVQMLAAILLYLVPDAVPITLPLLCPASCLRGDLVFGY